MGSLYRSQHELVFVFKNGTRPHKNNIELGKFGRYRTNVWNYPGANSFSRNTSEGNLLELHPTVKPVALVADAILDATKRGDIVLDPFVGSGTTIIAAERTGRICYAMEIDPGYADTAIRRWQKVTGKVAVREGTSETFDELASIAVNESKGELINEIAKQSGQEVKTVGKKSSRLRPPTGEHTIQEGEVRKSWGAAQRIAESKHNRRENA
jgi:adenine specific DNA methylase Mod